MLSNVWNIEKNYCVCWQQRGTAEKSLLFAFLSGLFAALQFAALFIVVEALVSDNRDRRFIWISLGIMAVSLVGRIITTYFSTMEQTETGYCMVAEKRIHIGDRLRYIPMGYFNKNSIGNITAIVTTTLGDVENSAARVLVSVLGGFFNSVALVIVLLVFDWRIGLIAAIGVLLYLVAAELALRKSACLSGVRQHTQESLVESVLEYIQGMGIVKAFGMEKDSTQSIDSAIKASCRDNLKLTKASVPYDALKQVVVRVFSVLLPLASIYFWLNGSLSLAYGVILVIASFMVFNDLENAGNMASLLQMLALLWIWQIPLTIRRSWMKRAQMWFRHPRKLYLIMWTFPMQTEKFWIMSALRSLPERPLPLSARPVLARRLCAT
mgnify:CR=1 FL=1